MNLSAHQTAAVTTSAKQVIVTAVPGSGKSTVLVARILHMLDQGIDPRSIVAVTFTRHAAAQLRERIGDAGRRVVIGTLHSFCLKLIMQMGSNIGYEADWLTIKDDDDAMLEQYDALAELGIIGRGPDGKRVWRLCKATEWERFAENVQAGIINPQSDKVPEVFRLAWASYMDRLRSQNTLTFGTILTEAYRLLDDRKALAIFRRKYRHFLIDEAQDTSSLQWSIVWRLVRKANPDSLYVVGDADQAIYQWRGAAPDELLAMARSTKTTCYTLPVTYRYGPGIAEPAQRLIEHNQARFPTKIETVRPGGSADIRIEVQPIPQIVDAVRDAIAGRSPRDVAVISRRHKPLIELEARMKAAGVPCRRIGAMADIRRTAEFRMCIAYIRCAANPRDRRAFAMVATVEGIDASMMMVFRSLAAAGTPIGSLWFTENNPAPWRPEELFAKLRKADPERDYMQALHLIREAVLFQGCDSPAELDRYFAMADIQDEIAQTSGEDVVTLCTTHAAKGLEWPVVIVIDVCEQVWPSGGSLKEGREEEERRLLYVAATRAREALMVIPTVGGEDLRLMSPSRFIAEMRGEA